MKLDGAKEIKVYFAGNTTMCASKTRIGEFNIAFSNDETSYIRDAEWIERTIEYFEFKILRVEVAF